MTSFMGDLLPSGIVQGPGAVTMAQTAEYSDLSRGYQGLVAIVIRIITEKHGCYRTETKRPEGL